MTDTVDWKHLMADKSTNSVALVWDIKPDSTVKVALLEDWRCVRLVCVRYSSWTSPCINNDCLCVLKVVSKVKETSTMQSQMRRKVINGYKAACLKMGGFWQYFDRKCLVGGEIWVQAEQIKVSLWAIPALVSGFWGITPQRIRGILDSYHSELLCLFPPTHFEWHVYR